MNAIKNTVLALILGMVILFTVSCDPAGPNNTGTEFMPDMGHSLAYEANVYGDIRESNNWDEESTFKVKDLSGPRLPVNGTVPRGYAGISASKGSEVTEMMDVLNGKAPNSVYTPKNGHVGYYYADTEEERTRATAEVIDNPFPIEDARLKEAKELYNIFCGVCHGEKGDGNGYIYETGVYPAAPANFLSEEFIAASNKLRNFPEGQHVTYTERKKKSIEITENIIKKNSPISDQYEYFIKNKKKDDLADSFLQGIWYLQEYNIINNVEH